MADVKMQRQIAIWLQRAKNGKRAGDSNPTTSYEARIRIDQTIRVLEDVQKFVGEPKIGSDPLPYAEMLAVNEGEAPDDQRAS